MNFDLILDTAHYYVFPYFMPRNISVVCGKGYSLLVYR
jgi:hypothetical protein